MAYPKPLSEKSLARLYKESGLTQAQIDYLHRLFLACANLYGALPLREVWNVHQMQAEAPKLRRKELIAFSGIARREALPYRVYEIDELYSEETRADLSREIVSRALISYGYASVARYYGVMDSMAEVPCFIPSDILQYEHMTPSKEETALLCFLNRLQVTEAECHPPYGNPYPCENRGKRLGEFSFLSTEERFEEEYLAKQPRALQAFRDSVAGTEAEKIIRNFRRIDSTTDIPFTRNLEIAMEELREVGVSLSERQTEKLCQLLTDFHNHTHLWNLRGWTPEELHAQYEPQAPQSLAIGPNMRKLFEDGTLSKDAFMEELRKRGIELLE